MELPIEFTLESLPTDIIGVLVSMDPKVYWRVASLTKSLNTRVKRGLPSMQAKKLFTREIVKKTESRVTTYHKLPNGNLNGIVTKNITMLNGHEFWGSDCYLRREDPEVWYDDMATETTEVNLLTTNEITDSQTTRDNTKVLADYWKNSDEISYINDHNLDMLGGVPALPQRRGNPQYKTTTLTLCDLIVDNVLVYGVNINDSTKIITREGKEIIYALGFPYVHADSNSPDSQKPKYKIDSINISCGDVFISYMHSDGAYIRPSIGFNHDGIIMLEHESAHGYELHVLAALSRNQKYYIGYKTSKIYDIAKDKVLRQQLFDIFITFTELNSPKYEIMKSTLKKLCREKGWDLIDVVKKRRKRDEEWLKTRGIKNMREGLNMDDDVPDAYDTIPGSRLTYLERELFHDIEVDELTKLFNENPINNTMESGIEEIDDVDEEAPANDECEWLEPDEL